MASAAICIFFAWYHHPKDHGLSDIRSIIGSLLVAQEILRKKLFVVSLCIAAAAACSS